MAGMYLLPENISASDTAMVLDFLNAAESAEEIASAIEIPGELDIGLKISGRILHQREQLGRFTTLQQVYAVPYIGPERFTELVTSLSSAYPPQSLDTRIDPALLAQINQRLERLELSSDRAPSIRLQAINPDALLGQSIVLLAELQDGDGKPLVDQSLTVTTTWGRLTGRAGLQPVEGNSITVRSDHLGLCKLQLSAALGENLTQQEHASLIGALALLKKPSNSPLTNLPELTEIAHRYRSPGNDSLRRAIDIYFKHYGDAATLTAPVDSLNQWPRIPITVVAWLTPAPELSTSHVPTTLLNVQQRNWFYAWLWAYRQLLEEKSELGNSLLSVNGDDRSGSAVLSDIFSRIDSFVQAQHGLIGQQLGETYAANNLNHFLQTGLKKFPPEERIKLITGVTAGVKSLGNTQRFSAFGASRTDLNLEIDSRITDSGSAAKLSDMKARLDKIESGSVTLDDIQGIRADILAEVTRESTLKLSEMEARLTKVESGHLTLDDIEGIRADILAEVTRESTLKLNEIEARLTKVESGHLTLDDIEGIRADILTEVTRESMLKLDDMEARLTKVESGRVSLDDIEGIRADILTEVTRESMLKLDDMEARLTKVESGRVTADDLQEIRADILEAALQETTKNNAQIQKDINRQLETKADAASLDQLNQQMTTLSNETLSLNTNLNKVNTQLKGIDSRVDTLNTRLPPR